MASPISLRLDAEQNVASTYDAVADLIGVTTGGNPARSEATGRRFTRLLKNRRAG